MSYYQSITVRKQCLADAGVDLLYGEPRLVFTGPAQLLHDDAEILRAELRELVL